ncbi:MAG: hypothetical protein ACOC1U_06345 [Spirochaetota bacterium]
MLAKLYAADESPRHRRIRNRRHLCHRTVLGAAADVAPVARIVMISSVTAGGVATEADGVARTLKRSGTAVYAVSKAQAEQLVRSSGAEYCMFRTMFDIPLEASGRTFVLAGGGENGRQIYGTDVSMGLMREMGVPVDDRGLFNPDAEGFCLDWYDTEESQRILDYQHHTFEDYVTRV